jgi:O-antigen ligase
LRAVDPQARVTGGGVACAILAFSLAASAMPFLRIPVGSAMVHPYLIPLVVVLAASLGQIERVPRGVLGFLFLVGALYLMAVSRDGTFVGETLKIVASGVTLVTAAMLLRTRADFALACLALAAAGAIISIRGFMGGSIAGEGINPFKGLANKNAYSLFALPALLVAGYQIFNPAVRRRAKLILGVLAFITVVGLFSTANRSGWLGVLLIAVMLGTRGRSLRGVVLVGFLGVTSYFLIERFGNPDLIQSKITQTQTGYQSDTKRRDLIYDAVSVGLRNPFLGVGHDALTRQIGRRMIERPIETHNVFAHLIGATGFLTTFAFAGLGWALWRRPRRRPTPEQKSARGLLRMMLVLWIVRGMFTHEILYSPGFAMGIGLALGLCLVEGEYDPPHRQNPVQMKAPA